MIRDNANPPKPETPADDFAVRYRLLFENSMDGILLTSPGGGILHANRSACEIMGRTEEEILREGRQGLIDSDDPNLRVLLEQRARTGKAHGELRCRRKDGTLFPIEMSSVVFLDPAGEERTCIIFRDITQRKQLEAERERLIAELQEALGKVRMLSGLLPICASCKKIRDEKGAWNELETYVRKHTQANFSHGICPDCMHRLYPEYCKK